MGIVCFGAEPGKADRDSSSDCFTFLPTGFRTNEKHLVFARGLPGSDLGTMQIHLTVRKRTGNVDSRKATIAFAHPRDIGNSEAAIQFRYVQHCIHIAFVERIRKQQPSAAPARPAASNCKPKTNFQTASYVRKESYSGRITTLLPLPLASIWQVTEHPCHPQNNSAVAVSPRTVTACKTNLLHDIANLSTLAWRMRRRV